MKDPFLHRLVAQQVLRNDAIQIGRCHVVVPRALGLHTHHRAAFTSPKAVDAVELGSPGSLMDTGRLELGPQAVIQLLPRTLLPAARAGAKEHIVFVGADRGFGGQVNRH